jgi:hypothetical protein
VIAQLKKKYFPYMMGQHYMAHKTNLVVQALLDLPMMVKSEGLLQSLYFYFSSSPKQHSEFIKLLEIVESKRVQDFVKCKNFLDIIYWSL